MDTKTENGVKTGSAPEIRRGIILWIVKGIFAKLIVGAILFGCAGRIDWIWAWASIGLFFLSDIATAAALLPISPELLAKRSAIQEGTKGWDKVVVQLAAGLFPLASLAVAGLDERYGWTNDLPLWVHIAALVGVAVGYGLIVWAMASNAHFELTVRIQKDRAHKVATGGPYAFVRHPGYVGAILVLGPVTSILLGSWWAMIPGALSAVGFVVRTALEDRTLQEELEGYKAYTTTVRFRLLPGVW
jgi:protein-S-isoprenylcysteine O-methyltransferase Ste14